MRRGKVYTSKCVDLIRKLAGEGKSATEIALEIGSTPGTVRLKCSQLKIKIAKRNKSHWLTAAAARTAKATG